MKFDVDVHWICAFVFRVCVSFVCISCSDTQPARCSNHQSSPRDPTQLRELQNHRCEHCRRSTEGVPQPVIRKRLYKFPNFETLPQLRVVLDRDLAFVSAFVRKSRLGERLWTIPWSMNSMVKSQVLPCSCVLNLLRFGGERVGRRRMEGN